MHIFTKNERTVDIFLGQIGLDFVDTAIHSTIDIGIVILLGTFVLDGTAFLYRFQPIVGTLEIDSVSGFVAQ